MMEEWKGELLTAATTSEAFPSKDRPLHRRILEHLAEHSSPEERPQRSERFLEEHFFPLEYGGKVAMYIKRLAEGLERYFDSDEGQRQTYRIELLRGRGVDRADRYAIRFVLNGKGLLRRFWQPLLDRRYRTLIAYGVPLFMRTADQRSFSRRADVNVEADVRRENSSDEICWPFVAHGDLLAAMELSRWLTGQGAVVHLASFKADDRLQALANSTTDDANVIALGSIRVNGILDEYQGLELRGARGTTRRHLPFRIRLFDVVRVNAQEQPVGSPFEEEHLKNVSSVPVVITRRPGAIRSSVTLIASNHGRAVYRAAQILTNQDELQELFSNERVRGWAAKMPEHFQIVLRINVLAQEDVAGTYVLEEAWADS